MRRHAGPGTGTLLILASLLLVGTAGGAFAQAGPPALNGTIVSVDGDRLTLALADKSEKVVVLQSGTLVLERNAVTAADIKPGDAMGVAARRSGTDLIATSINIFAPEMWTGARKGQWPMTSGETMTNALVTSYATGMSGHTLMMSYQDVAATITVPDNVPIHRLTTVKPGALTAGLSISVRGMTGSDGTIKAAAISFDGPART